MAVLEVVTVLSGPVQVAGRAEYILGVEQVDAVQVDAVDAVPEDGAVVAVIEEEAVKTDVGYGIVLDIQERGLAGDYAFLVAVEKYIIFDHAKLGVHKTEPLHIHVPNSAVDVVNVGDGVSEAPDLAALVSVFEGAVLKPAPAVVVEIQVLPFKSLRG